MKSLVLAVLFSVSLALNGFSQEEASNLPELKPSKQLVLVLTKKRNAVQGGMWRFERADEHSPWKEVGGRIPIVVGRNGMAWGKGLNPPMELPGPRKKEGDGKSPAGVFRLSSAFGLAELNEARNVKLPYQPLSDLIECVDDVKSIHYNSIVDRSKVNKVDWNSSEKMREVGERYRWGVVVDHNVNPRVAGGGSCIFMHIWKDSKTGTSGCTAMSRENMEQFLPWLKPDAQPVLVQLPESEYNHLHKDWQLPKP